MQNVDKVQSNAESPLYLGIDIGGTAVKMGIVTDSGDILHKNQYSVAFDQYQTPILDTVLEKSQSFLYECNIAPASLVGIGISATGQIDSIQGIVAGTGGNIRNWQGARIKESFFDLFHKPVTVINDANCVALGEQWLGNAKDAQNAIILTIGTGLGGGLIVNHEILLGDKGFAGELGHFSIHSEGRPCTCGNTGCFEQYASMTSLIRQVKEYYQKIGKIPENEINGLYIFEQIKQKNTALSEIVDHWISDIARGITSLVHIFNPSVVLIGGAVSLQQELFIDKLKLKLQNKIMPNFRNSLSILPAKLGNDAGLIGAVYYVKNHME